MGKHVYYTIFEETQIFGFLGIYFANLIFRIFCNLTKDY